MVSITEKRNLIISSEERKKPLLSPSKSKADENLMAKGNKKLPM